MSASLPYRQLSRLSTELGVSRIERLTELLPGRIDEGLFFILVARVCAPDWIHGDTIAAPTEIGRTTSVNAMATSLGRPPESVRRRVRYLLDRGLLVRTPAGVALSNATDQAPAIVAFFRAFHDLLIRYVEDAYRTCDLIWPQPRATRPPVLDIVVRSLDAGLMPLSYLASLVGNWQQMVLWLVIGAANIRHVTYDPVLARTYALASSPDELRRPVPLHPIAARLGIPYATAWRYARTLESEGLIVWEDGGLVVQTHNLRQTNVDTMVVSTIDYLTRAVREIVIAGLDPARASDFYLDGRPPLMAL